MTLKTVAGGGIYTIAGGVSLKVNVIEQLEFELTQYNVNHCTIEIPPDPFGLV